MTVRAAGGVVWRRDSSGCPLVALVHRPAYDDWSLPKGKLRADEQAAVAAAREVGEETGQRVALGRRLGRSRYPVTVDGTVVTKTVRWWAMKGLGGEFVPGEEVDELAWLAPAAALERLRPPHDDAPLRRWLAGPVEPSVVLLVRHARAGDPQEWHGPDHLRPLDDSGRRQAQGLADLLPCFAPGLAVSAPPLRCRQTVAPAAERLGLHLEIDEALGEDRYWRDPAGSAAAIVRHAGPVPALLCSQGGVIPDVLRRLSASPNEDAPAARKGSVWVLSLVEGTLVAADYMDSLR
ncbi:MAG: NUDIX hydrolase [Actinomycetota bacterium]|nr:NUDIX hydrolase [Actinomycetota bacterium]